MTEADDFDRPVLTRLSPARAEAIAEAVDVLRSGGLVAFPTDTVYGVGAHVLHPQAVEKLYWAKGRPANKAIPLLLSRAEDVEQAAEGVPPEAGEMMKRFWPGGLTLVLRARPEVPEVVTAGTGTVAVRVPKHPVAIALIAALGVPLATTSANRSGLTSAVTASEARRHLGGRVEIILDGGRCPGGVASTVLDLTGKQPRLLRRGAIDVGQLEEALGQRIEQGG